MNSVVNHRNWFTKYFGQKRKSGLSSVVNSWCRRQYSLKINNFGVDNTRIRISNSHSPPVGHNCSFHLMPFSLKSSNQMNETKIKHLLYNSLEFSERMNELKTLLTFT